MKHRQWPLTKRLVEMMSRSDLSDLTLKRQPRSEGLHASDLLKELHPPAGDGDIDEQQLRIYGLMGLAFEDRAELALQQLEKEDDWPYHSFRPGEVEAEDVAMSPDIILHPKKAWKAKLPRRELSLKVSWKSYRTLPLEPGEDEWDTDKFGYYVSQCQTYAHALETTGSILVCYFVCGMWRPKPFPKVLGWELDFEPNEIQDTWDALMTIKGAREKDQKKRIHPKDRKR